MLTNDEILTCNELLLPLTDDGINASLYFPKIRIIDDLYPYSKMHYYINSNTSISKYKDDIVASISFLINLRCHLDIINPSGKIIMNGMEFKIRSLEDLYWKIYLMKDRELYNIDLTLYHTI